jgi:sortase A
MPRVDVHRYDLCDASGVTAIGHTGQVKKRSVALSGALVALGLVLLVVAAVGVAYPLWWMHRSQSGGRHLLHEPLGGGSTSVTGTCRPVLPRAGGSTGRLAGILSVPSLHLRAPVLQGLGDPVLNVAVGHDPGSPWPGRLGESIVEAHDVSYFAAIDALKPGNTVIWRNACSESTFRVISSEIVTPGAFIHTPPNSRGLALVTCYPTNALFWTSERYVVLTDFVARHGTTRRPTSPQLLGHLVVPAPPVLVAQGLTLQDNPILLGTLSIVGSPSPAFRQGPAPLNVEAAALESFFGAQKAIAEGNRGWWSDLAVPGLPVPAAWSDPNPYYVTIDVVGNSVRTVRLGSANLAMLLVVRHGTLFISSVSP